MHIPVLFLCFIVFILWFRVKSKQSNSESVWDKEYWEKERAANFSRKKDISDLKYLEIDRSALPFSDCASGEEETLQANVLAISEQKMLDLSHYTNADIKLEFGQVNFDMLTECDQNYQSFQRSLDRWGICLFDNGDYKRSQQVLEYALSLGSDISTSYVTLGKIALLDDNLEYVQNLITRIQETDSIMKTSIVKQLTELLQSY